MSNADARAERIRTESPNRIERKIITYMMLDKTYTEIMAILSQDGVQLFANPAGQVWGNLAEQVPEFFAAYYARQREISARMTFIPTPGIYVSESEAATLAPGPIPSDMGGPSDVLERNSSLNAATVQNNIPESSGTKMTESYSGSPSMRAAEANTQGSDGNREIINIPDDSDGSSDLLTQTHKKPKRARNRTRIASYLRNLNKTSYKISKSTRKLKLY